MAEEFWLIAFSPAEGAWFILDSRDMSQISGPYSTHDDILEGMRTRAYRLAQGWKP